MPRLEARWWIVAIWLAAAASPAAEVPSPPPSVSEPPPDHTAFIQILSDADRLARQTANDWETTGGDVCATAALALESMVESARVSLPDMPVDKIQLRNSINERLGAIAKICSIWMDVCEEGGDTREIASLIQQIRNHIEESQRECVAALGPVTIDKKVTAPVPYEKWKSEIHSIRDQLINQTAAREWERIAKLGATLNDVAGGKSVMPPLTLRRLAEREMLNYERERLALYGDIVKEYAEDENLPHIQYFLNKIEATISALP